MKKSAAPVPPAPFRPGPDARRGRGPRKGAPNAGRPPDQWKLALRALADREAVLAHVDRALLAGPVRPKLDENGNRVCRVEEYKGKPFVVWETEGDPFFDRALDYVTEHGYGRAGQSVDVTSNGKELAALTWRFGGREVNF